MGLPQLETCCFIFDLKTGNLIMGAINALFSFILTIMMIVVASSIGDAEGDSSLPLDVEARSALTGLFVMSVILVLMFLVKFVFDVMFIYGVVHGRAGVIRTYFISWSVFFLLSLFTFFFNAAHYGAGTIVTELFYIGLNVYAILLGHSFYKQINVREVV